MVILYRYITIKPGTITYLLLKLLKLFKDEARHLGGGGVTCIQVYLAENCVGGIDFLAFIVFACFMPRHSRHVPACIQSHINDHA